MCRHRVVFIGIVSLIFLIGCSSSDSPDEKSADSSTIKQSQNKYIIAVVGSGVSSTTRPQEPTYARSVAAGESIMRGIRTAFYNSTQCREINAFIDLDSLDTGARIDIAKERAQALQKEPRVLAVIGHVTSGETRAAAPIYAEAGIPLIIPIGVSVTTVLPPNTPDSSSERFTNYLRVLPNTKWQAHALAYYVKTLADSVKGPFRCDLISDTSSGVYEYSKFLSKEVSMLLDKLGLIYKTREINSDNTGAMLDVARLIAQDKVSAVIYCGYSTSAPNFLGDLKEAFSENGSTTVPGGRPKVILTSACLNPKTPLAPQGFDVSLLFPLPDIDSLPKKSSEDWNLLNNAIKDSPGQSYEIAGYAAMRILA